MVLIDCYKHLFDQLPVKHGLTTIKGCTLVRPWQNPLICSSSVVFGISCSLVVMVIGFLSAVAENFL